jgi:hypothetical protein
MVQVNRSMKPENMQFWGNEQGDRWFACNSMQQYEKTDGLIYIYMPCVQIQSPEHERTVQMA